MLSGTINRERILVSVALMFVLLLLSSVQPSQAAEMSDYCITPPYIGAQIEPNLLLMIDNSASMYDLAWTDTSNYYCANAANTSCTYGSTCSGTAYCLASTQTTTTTTTPTPVTCLISGSYSDAVCNAILPGDTCWTVGSKKGQCKNAKTVTTTVTVNPIECDGQPTNFCGDTTLAGHVAGDSCNNTCTVTHSCYDNTYSSSNSYVGYFTATDAGNNTVYYSYDATNGKFTSGDSLPDSCDYSNTGSPATPSSSTYVCVNTSGTGATEAVTEFVASGNFLNWLTASKFDIEKQILTGGKYDTSNQLLIAESRGCSGRKFVKTVPGMPDITFAIRGGGWDWLDKITNQATEYGTTHIEVYKGTYDAGDCAAAVNDWMNINTTNLGTVQNDTKNCAGTTSTAQIAFNQSIHDCYWYYNGHGLSNLNPIENACVNDWNIISAPSITSPDASDSICSSVLTHANSLVWSSGATGYNTGYLGLCYNDGVWDNTCAYKENVDYCAGIGAASAVTDPASSQVVTGSLMSVPGFVMESGLAGLTSMATLTVQVGLAAPPIGLINKYQNLIRFGAMTFQNNGSATECNTVGSCSLHTATSCSADSACPSGEKCVFQIPCAKVCSNLPTRQCYTDTDCPPSGTCGTLTKTDGGVITNYVGAGNCSVTTGTSCVVDSDCPSSEICLANVGSHSAGLINSIDNIQATSWTPFSEAFYNAIGYFARSNDYPTPPATAVPTSRSNFNFSGLPQSYNTNDNPSQKPCQKNNVLIVTDGMSTADQNPQVDGASGTGLAGSYASAVSSVVSGITYTNVYGYDSSNKCPQYAGSRSLPVLTWAANHRNIKNLSRTDPTVKHCANDIFGPTCSQDSDCAAGDICTNVPTRSSESISTYVVYAGQGTSNLPGLCNPLTFMTAAATNGGTQVLQASNLTQLNSILTNAFDQVAARAASGTAASVLASGEGSGSNLIQAIFYPHKRFANSVTGIDDEIDWVGRLTNLWYYVDPFANNSSIIEDNGIPSGSTTNATPWAGDKIETLQSTANTSGDFIAQMFYDKNAGVTMANRWADQGNGVIGTQLSPTITFENLGYLWESGTMLWQRNLSTNPRTIKTSIDGKSFKDFSTSNASTLAPYLQAASPTEASNIISWVTGSDVSGYRSRTVMVTNIDSTPRVWKLGDVINSTPRIQSWLSLNNYGTHYGDMTYGSSGLLSSAVDNSHFTTTSAYKSRGMVYAGGNDGMLHAFKLGTLQQQWPGQGANQNARLVNPDTGAACSASDTVPCGQEMWAYIPKQALPYLKYIADPAYCHVDAVDLTPYVFDASIGGPPDSQRTVSNWKTVLIGGMRFGGGCRKSCGASTDCVNTPTTDPLDATKGLGYSSYFALDVTDPNNPILLWEFSDEGLGFSTTGPAIVRIDGKTGTTADPNTNGNWYVVFGSGPTGPIDTSYHQFLGHSDQNLKLYVLDLRGPGSTNPWVQGTNYWVLNTPVPNAFSGSLMGASLDTDNDYQDEVVYVPYVKKDTATWTNGGIGRLLTMKKPDPSQWQWGTLIDGIGPVTAAPAKILDVTASNLWVYVGTGRYYYAENNVTDDPTNQRTLYGIKDPCMKPGAYDINCLTDGSQFIVDSSRPLTDVTDTSNVPSQSFADGSSFYGWKINLDQAGQYADPAGLTENFMAERVITDPLATSGGVAFFTTFKPYTDLCLLGGESFIWALQYDTGGVPTNLKGVALVQVSTGAIQQLDLSKAMTQAGGRKSAAFEGKPPEAQGLSVQTSPPPVNRYIHMRER